MSLLMKALEKAAKDRVEARAKQEPAPVPASPQAREPKLEPAEAKPASPPAPGMSPIPTPNGELALEPLGTPPPRGPEPKTPVPRAEPPPRRNQEAPKANGKPSPEQEHAATVLQATSRAEGGVGANFRSRPLLVFGVLAGLFAIGFGTYIYLQIFNPGFFVRQGRAPRVPPPLATAPASPAVPAPTGDLPLPLPTAPLLRQPPNGVSGAVVTPSQPAAIRPPLTDGAPPSPPQPEPVTPRSTIVVSPGSPVPRVDPLLTDAYAALTADRVDTASELYGRLLKSNPRSVDALLGLAAIAVRDGKTEDAVQRYVAILEHDPRNAVAQSGLIALLGRADPLAAESRLKQLIAREPSGHLYFTLGNLYADQSQWAQAQHAYFQAHHLEPTNPDYAYNLAVGLEHVGQQKLALGFYQRAVALAAARPRVNFDLARAQERVAKLAPLAQ